MAKKKRKKSRGIKAKKSKGKRPLAFLKKMHAKMRVNVVKLDKIIKARS